MKNKRKWFLLSVIGLLVGLILNVFIFPFVQGLLLFPLTQAQMKAQMEEHTVLSFEKRDGNWIYIAGVEEDKLMYIFQGALLQNRYRLIWDSYVLEEGGTGFLVLGRTNLWSGQVENGDVEMRVLESRFSYMLRSFWYGYLSSMLFSVVTVFFIAYGRRMKYAGENGKI